MSSRMIFHSAQVVLIPLFTCNTCGVEGVGDRTLRVEAHSKEDVLTLASRHRANPHAMPVGWASYGNDIFRCEGCKLP